MLNFQNPSRPMIEGIVLFHDSLLTILISISTRIMMTMFIYTYGTTTYRAFTESQTVEFLWTITPVFILLVLVAPSLRLLYLTEDNVIVQSITKAIGHQWYWQYEYPGLESFESYIITNIYRLLDTNNRIVIPIGQQLQILITASDVLHSWTLPTIGVKGDAVPGRVNKLTLFVKRYGVYFGQCREICGSNHSFIPITAETIFNCPSILKIVTYKVKMFPRWYEEAHWLQQLAKSCTDPDQPYFIITATFTIFSTYVLINGLNKKGMEDFILILFLNTVWPLFLFSLFHRSLWLQLAYFSAILVSLPTIFLIIWKLRWDKYSVKLVMSLWGSLYVGIHALVMVGRGVFIIEYVYLSMILSIPFVWHILCYPSEEFQNFMKTKCRKKVSLDVWLRAVVYFVISIITLILFITRAVCLDSIMTLESVPRQIKNTYNWIIDAHPLICTACLPSMFLFGTALNYAFIQIYPNYKEGPYHILLLPLKKRLSAVNAPWYLIIPSTLLYFAQKLLPHRNASYWISCFWVLVSFIFTVSLLYISGVENLYLMRDEWINEINTLDNEVHSFLSYYNSRYFLFLLFIVEPWFFSHLLYSYDHTAVHLAMSLF